MVLSKIGTIVEQELSKSMAVRDEIDVTDHVVMPNHVHAVIRIRNDASVGATGRSPGPRPKSLGSFVGGFKASVTRRVRAETETQSAVWQRNYHDRIVRSPKELDRVRSYIKRNPRAWNEDRHNQSTATAKEGP